MNVINHLHWQWSLHLGIGLVSTLLGGYGQCAPRTPIDDSVVIERLPFRAGSGRQRGLADLRANVLKAPKDGAAGVALAQAYFDQALALGDPRYVGYADAIVARFDKHMTPDLLMMRGMLRQYRHDFSPALSDFASALELDPELASAHAWRGAIYLVQAHYSQANQECDALLRLRRNVLHGGCRGLLLAYTGQLDRAYVTLQNALTLASDQGQRLWLLTRLGEVAAWQGKPSSAERHYREALALGRDDGYLLAAWSDFLLDTNRPEEVEKLLALWKASDGLLLRLAEAEKLLERPAAATHIKILEDRFSAAKLRGDTTHQAEESRFQLRLRNNPKLAVQLAAANFQEQKEPRDLRALLESARLAKDGKAAQAAFNWLTVSGFEDSLLRSLAQDTAQQLSVGSSSSISKP